MKKTSGALRRLGRNLSVTGLICLLPGSAVVAQTTETAGRMQGSGFASAIPQKPAPNPSEEVSALVVQLRSSDLEQRRQAASKLQQRQQTTGHQLLESAKKQVQEVQQARKKYDDSAAKLTPAEQEKQVLAIQQQADVAWETIRLLGELHVEEAIPFLVENVGFAAPQAISRRWNLPINYPCVGALIALGPSAADAVLYGIEDDSIRNSRWAEQVLARMLGPDGAAGYIQERIDRLTARQKRSYPPVIVAPGKPSPTPVAVRIKRLKTVRTELKATPEEWSGLRDFLKPDVP